MKLDKRVGIYARCSTSDQSTDMQLSDLEQFSIERRFKIYRIYKDNGISGTQESRPALNELMNDARKKRFDIVLCWRFDRFARSSKHLITALHEFKNLGIDFVSFQENIDTSSPLGEAIFTIISAMSKLERDIIAERVKGGLRRAQANGKRLGRPKSIVDIDKLVDFRKQNMSIRRIADEMSLSKGTIEKALKTCL